MMKQNHKQLERRRRQTSARMRPWLWMAALVTVFAIGGVLAFASRSQVREVGVLVTELTLQDVGRVSMREGLVEATFPITVQGETRVTGLTTS